MEGDFQKCAEFQSRYRAASHFRFVFLLQMLHVYMSFNLVIERLLISGSVPEETEAFVYVTFQSRYRAASHFRYY